MNPGTRSGPGFMLSAIDRREQGCLRLLCNSTGSLAQTCAMPARLPRYSNAGLEATLQLAVQDADGQAIQIDAIIDTGFTGYLTLPAGTIANLALPWLCRQPGILADGSVQVLDVYMAVVVWDGRPRLVEVDALEAESLVGMSMLQGHELRIEVARGANVSIRALH